MRQLYFLYLKYALWFNLILSGILVFGSRIISRIYSSDDLGIWELQKCIIILGIYTVIYQLRVFTTSYLRSNNKNKFSFVVSGIIYPAAILSTCELFYRKRISSIYSLIWCLGFSDYLINYLLFSYSLLIASYAKKQKPEKLVLAS